MSAIGHRALGNSRFDSGFITMTYLVADVGRYPDSEQGLKALIERPQNEPKWNGPYLRKDVPDDPWGKPYVYKIPGEKWDFELVSFGKDGQPGGAGEAADITNR